MLAGAAAAAARARLRFPLGELTKPQVREHRARRPGLPVAEKRESQDLCFLAGTSRERFLARHGGVRGPPRRGRGQRAGACSARHRGHRRFTVGQRRGLGVAAGEPLYVLATDAATQPGRGRAPRRSSRAARVALSRRRSCTATRQRVDRVKLRYRSEPVPCRVAAAAGVTRRSSSSSTSDACGVAPGQTACLMDGDRVVGHGTIAASRSLNSRRDGRTRSSAEIREAFLSFFEERDHRRMPSASLCPSSYDPSVLLTTAGMQPFKPYFLGQEQPPHPRLTSCQKCFRTTDIDQVGLTARHLTFFEMLGNFSFGDYFKQERRRVRVGAVARGVRARPGADLDHGLRGRRRARPRAGRGGDRVLARDRRARRSASCGCRARRTSGRPARPARAAPARSSTSTAGPTSAAPRTAPGDDTERFLEFWNLVFMQYSLHEDGSLEPLPKRNIDTGLGLDRMAAILQDVPSVFENDQFRPLVELGEELSGRRYGSDPATTRALRVLADHSRAMTFLIADGVVPSNEDRGYILRRIMRRAIQQGRSIGLEPPLPGPVRRRRDRGHGRRPTRSCERERDTIHQWLDAEEESFGRTLEQGTRLLRGPGRRARRPSGTSWIDARGRLPAARHLRLPVRPHARAAPGRGAVRRRRGLPRADGGAARARAHRRGARATAPRASTSR